MALWVGFWFLWILTASLAIGFGLVVFFGAPYVPTLKKQRQQAIELISLKKGQVFVDLGCGDGSLLIMAADQGWKAIGYEINPFLAIIAWKRTRRHSSRVKIVCGSFWKADLSQADGVFVFLIGRYMSKLDRLITKQPHKKLKVVSNAFAIPGRRAVKKLGPHFLYEYRSQR